LEEKGVKKRNSSPLKADEDQEVLKRLKNFFTGPDGNVQNIFFGGRTHTNLMLQAQKGREAMLKSRIISMFGKNFGIDIPSSFISLFSVGFIFKWDRNDVA